MNDDNCESSFLDLKINISTIISIGLFSISELLGFKKKYHSISGLIKYYILLIYIRAFPNSALANEIDNITMTASTDSKSITDLQRISSIDLTKANRTKTNSIMIPQTIIQLDD